MPFRLFGQIKRFISVCTLLFAAWGTTFAADLHDLKTAAIASPGNPTPWIVLAQEALLQNELEESIAAYLYVREHFPGRADGWVGLIRVYGLAGDCVHSSDMAKSAVKCFPNHPQVILEAAWALFQCDDWHRAFRLYRRFSQLVPEDVRGYTGAGWSLFYMNEVAAARGAWQRALEINPDEPSALEGLALAPTVPRFSLLSGIQGFLFSPESIKRKAAEVSCLGVWEGERLFLKTGGRGYQSITDPTYPSDRRWLTGIEVGWKQLPDLRYKMTVLHTFESSNLLDHAWVTALHVALRQRISIQIDRGVYPALTADHFRGSAMLPMGGKVCLYGEYIHTVLDYDTPGFDRQYHGGSMAASYQFPWIRISGGFFGGEGAFQLLDNLELFDTPDVFGNGFFVTSEFDWRQSHLEFGGFSRQVQHPDETNTGIFTFQIKFSQSVPGIL